MFTKRKPHAGRRKGRKGIFCLWWPLPLTFDLDRQKHPSEEPDTSSLWIWRKSVQRFRRYFIHKQKTQTNGAKNRIFRRSLGVVIVYGTVNIYVRSRAVPSDALSTRPSNPIRENKEVNCDGDAASRPLLLLLFSGEEQYVTRSGISPRFRALRYCLIGDYQEDRPKRKYHQNHSVLYCYCCAQQYEHTCEQFLYRWLAVYRFRFLPAPPA